MNANKRTCFNFSDKSQVFFYRNGILLEDSRKIKKGSSCLYSLGIQVDDLLSLPCNVYFNIDGFIQKINHETAFTCGFDSRESAVGKTIEMVASKETVEFEYKHDQKVFSTKRFVLEEESYIRLDETSFSVLAIKFPWYNSNKEMMGIFGCSVVLGKQNLPESLLAMGKLGILSCLSNDSYIKTFELNRYIDGVYLTRRENEIACYTAKGKSAKLIAKIFNLSPRTVEQHLVNIKFKFGVSTKAELIEKIFNNFI